MKRFYRFIFQVCFWLFVWIIIGILADVDYRFIARNGVTFILQILLLAGLIYYAVPRLLFEKKYLQFFVITVPVILIAAFFAAQTAPPPFDKSIFLPAGGPPRGILGRYPIDLLILSISSIIAVVLETFIYAQEKEKSIALAKAELIESELKMLKMQINPHFLFNALNNIYALSVTNSDKTQESISTLSEMLRYVIYDCEQPKVPLQKELNYIENYIELFKLKSSKGYNIAFAKAVKNETTLVAPMLFVPYIENAFKHSGIEKGGGSFVNIALQQEKNKITFMVENSKPEEPSITDAQGGIGLPNVQKRLEILYPNQHTLTVKNKATFKIDLIINI
ncbi:sensor histidine kinase [Leeuwenhoekiella sp. NPDC079379]|uniref:sensor histidine kinase n=1 Tax=Leeuwenhoekiella sp. NPDC079379 TaxID=3364122 RepID=UPI0037C86967